MGNPAGVGRDFEALEKRRMEAVRLLEKGEQSRIAERTMRFTSPFRSVLIVFHPREAPGISSYTFLTVRQCGKR